MLHSPAFALVGWTGLAKKERVGGKKVQKAHCVTTGSQAIPQPSTSVAHSGLTAEIGRDRVHCGRYERSMQVGLFWRPRLCNPAEAKPQETNNLPCLLLAQSGLLVGLCPQLL